MATKKRARKAGGSKVEPRRARLTKAKARPRRKSAATRRPAVARSRPKPKSAPRPSQARATAPSPASAIGVTHQHVDYTSHALEDVKRFYTEVLGFRDSQYDPEFEYLSVRTSPGSSLGFMPPMPGPPEQWRPPREPAIYLHVRDVDRAHRELAARGVAFLQVPTDMPWKHRVAILRDPEGRTIMLAQPIAR